MKDKILKIKLLALDVDGVLTDGKIVYDSDGREIKFFNVQDGYGIVLFRKAGFHTAIISARSSAPVDIRAKDLKIEKVYQDAYPKRKAYDQMLKDFQLKDEDVCFIGDDLPDLDIIQTVGFGVTVADGNDEVKKNADYVTKRKGGEGAVREVVELIFKTQGRWEQIVKGEYL